MKVHSVEKKESPEENRGEGYEVKLTEDEVASEVQGDDELIIDSMNESVENGSQQLMQAEGISQVEGRRDRGSVVCWAQFLHLTSIKLLVVENDNSTRHIVTALLRNCNYEVIEAANGLQAWKILEDLSNHIDLILTEVVMPCLSGIALLCKIMNHKTRKNIPVIMMSSYDSMGLVFKCLSKGAVDFLVKPIRKNELKNLWQHVWRRCQSSSGSGSESDRQPSRSLKSEGNYNSENNSRSINGNPNGCARLDVGDESDASGTKSLWTKQDVEVDSSQAESMQNHATECADTICVQVCSNQETPGNRTVLVAARRELQQEREKQLERKLPEERCNRISKQKGNGQLNFTIEYSSNEHKAALASNSNSLLHGGEYAGLEEPDGMQEIKLVIDFAKKQVAELTSKRPRDVNDIEVFEDDRNIKRRSETSAFSKSERNSS